MELGWAAIFFVRSYFQNLLRVGVSAYHYRGRLCAEHRSVSLVGSLTDSLVLWMLACAIPTCCLRCVDTALHGLRSACVRGGLVHNFANS
jgi:hypothetical protein